MYCSNCGSKLQPGDAQCGTCGTLVARANTGFVVPADMARALAQSSTVKGLWVLFLTYFTMPFHTMRLAGRLLREIGAAGALDLNTDLPHLTWLRTAWAVIATLVFFIILVSGSLYNFVEFNSNMTQRPSHIGEHAGGFVAGLIGTYLAALLADWLIMFFSEMLALWINMANNIKRIADRG